MNLVMGKETGEQKTPTDLNRLGQVIVLNSDI